MTVSPITDADDGSHPPSDDPAWQESWFFCWHDPVARAGGYHHFGLQRNVGVADVWSWIAVDGRVCGRFQSHTLPLPADDMGAIDLGGISLRTLEPLRRHGVATRFAGGSGSDLVFTAFGDPLAFSWDDTGGRLGANHYESVGHVRGTVDDGTGPRAVDCFALQDHSWGPRDLSTLLASRGIQAFFGDDLFASFHALTTPKGSRAVGWIFEGGAFRPVVRTDFRVHVADDGHSPLGCDTRLWTGDGRGYRLSGAVSVSSVTFHPPAHFPTTGLATFELGGRLGAGLLEVNELSGPAPWHRAALGLDVPLPVPARPDQPAGDQTLEHALRPRSPASVDGGVVAELDGVDTV